MKKILITGGPTNEYIDEVMKITNMSSGQLAIKLTEYFSLGDYDVTLMINKSCKKDPLLNELICRDYVHVLYFETTEDLFNLLQEFSNTKYDAIIHSAAVGDYKPEFSFRLEDLAKELTLNVASTMINNPNGIDMKQLEDTIFNVLTNPNCKVNDETKISSVEPNLTVKLGLTPKIISYLREWYPEAYICGFKLLENVTDDKLIEAATKQVNKCNTNLCFANDLANLRRGDVTRLVVNKNGFTDVRVIGAEGIFNCIDIALNGEEEDY